MLIKMLQTRRGCEDGFTVKQYYKDEIYDLRDTLAIYFIINKYAKQTS